MAYRYSLYGDDEQNALNDPSLDDSLTVPPVMGSRVGAAAPSTEATVPAPVHGGLDAYGKPFDAVAAKRKELADLATGGGTFDDATLAAARNVLAGSLAAGDPDANEGMVKDPVTGRLVSTKPSWYKPGAKGPTDPNMPLNAIGVGLGAIGAGAQHQADTLAQNPYRTAGNKMLDQQRATGANMLSALASYFGNAGAKNEDRRLEHASKEAQMFRTLNPSKSGTTDPRMTSAANILRFDRDYRNTGLAGERAGLGEEKQGAQVQEKLDKENPQSPMAQRNAKIAVDQGLISPEAAAKYSDNDWKRWASTLSQKDQQRFTLGIKKFDVDTQNQQRADKLAEDQEVKIAQDANTRAHELADQSIQGGTWNRKASDRDRHDVLGLIDSQATLVNGAQEIAKLRGEIQKRFGNVEKGIELLGRADINVIPENAALLRRINGEKKAMDAAYSQIFQYGVPSGIEMTRTGQLSGATGLNSLLFPQEFYGEVAKEAQERLTPQINRRGFFFQGQEVPAEQDVQPQRVVAEHAPVQASPELEQITNPPSSPRPSQTPPSESPYPAPIRPGARLSTVTSGAGEQFDRNAPPDNVPPSENQAPGQGPGEPEFPVAPAESQTAVDATGRPAGKAPAAFTPPARIGAAAKPAEAPAAAAAPAPGATLSGTINGKPWKGTQADLDAIKKAAGDTKLDIQVK